MAVVGQVEIVRLGRVFTGQSINLFDARYDTEGFPLGPYGRLGRSAQTADLAIGETCLLGLDQQFSRADAAARAPQAPFDLDEVLDLLQEPAIDMGQATNVLDRVSPPQSLGDDIYPVRRRVL